MPTQLLGDGLHLACRHTLHVHLRQRRYQGFLRALVALEQFGREPPRPILRNAKLQDTDPSHQLAIVITRAMPQAPRRPLTLLGLQRLGHLRLEHLLHNGLQKRAKAILVTAQHRFPVMPGRRSLSIGHGVFPFHGTVTSNITTMPWPPRPHRFCRTFSTLSSIGFVSGLPAVSPLTPTAPARRERRPLPQGERNLNRDCRVVQPA